MKKLSFLIPILLASCSTSPTIQTAPSMNAQNNFKTYSSLLQYGLNPGYYGNGWDDSTIYQLGSDAGAHTTRNTLPDGFLAQYGTDIRLTEFTENQTVRNYGEVTTFLETPRDPRHSQGTLDTCDHSTDITWGANTFCSMWANMYEPIWIETAGVKTVNPENYMAKYVEEVAKNYGSFIRFYEIINEPDFGGSAWERDIKGSPGNWWDNAPDPKELPNLRTNVFQYIRALRIAYEVTKYYQPGSYVAPGGIGYPSFADVLMRYSDNPDGGKITPEFPLTGGAYFDALSFHSYPQFGVSYWDTKANARVYERHSDSAVLAFKNSLDAMKEVLAARGYDDKKFPTKPIIVTEINIPRVEAGETIGGDEVQKNFAIKVLVKAQSWGVAQMYFFSTGENQNVPSPIPADLDTLNHFSGFYENLTRDGPGNQIITQEGIGHRTLTKYIYGYRQLQR